MGRQAIVELLIKGKDQTQEAWETAEHHGADFATKIKVAIGVAFAALTTGAALEFGKFLLETAQQTEELTNQLKAFVPVGVSAEAVFHQLATLSTETPFSIEQLVQAYSILRTAGVTPTLETLKNLGNVASSTNGDLVGLARGIQESATRSAETLRQYGVNVHIVGDSIIATYKGQTTYLEKTTVAVTNYLETLGKTQLVDASTRKMEGLTLAIANIRASVRLLAVEIGDGGVSKEIAKEANVFADWVKELKEDASSVRHLIGLLLQVIITPVRTLMNVITIAYTAGKGITEFARQAFLALDVVVEKGLDLIFTGINKAIDAMNRLPGVHIGFRAPDIKESLQQAEDAFDEGKDRIDNLSEDLRTDLEDIRDSWVDLGKAALGSADDQQKAADQMAGMKDQGLATADKDRNKPDYLNRASVGGDATRQGASAEDEQIMRTTAALEGQAVAFRKLTQTGDEAKQSNFELMFEAMAGGATDADKAIRQLGTTLEYVATYLAFAFSSNWEQAWEAFGQGSISAGKAVVQAGRQAVADYARHKAMVTAIEAGEALAKGLTNPIELLKAAKLFAVSAAYGTLAGLAGGGGGGGGGGGAFASANDSNALTNQVEPGGVLIIEGGLINLNDPRQAEEFEDAINKLGKQGRLKIVSSGTAGRRS